MPTYRRFRAPLIVMFGVIIAVVAFAGPANAWPYKHHQTTSVSDESPTAGSSIEFCGADFQPGERVTITLDSSTKYPSVHADKSGAFCTTIVLGVSLTGNHTLTATGTESGLTSSTEIKVAGVSANAGPITSGGTTTSGGLAFTGAAVIGIGALGGLLLVGGATMVLASRRRKVVA